MPKTGQGVIVSVLLLALLSLAPPAQASDPDAWRNGYWSHITGKSEKVGVTYPGLNEYIHFYLHCNPNDRRPRSIIITFINEIPARNNVGKTASITLRVDGGKIRLSGVVEENFMVENGTFMSVVIPQDDPSLDSLGRSRTLVLSHGSRKQPVSTKGLKTSLESFLRRCRSG